MRFLRKLFRDEGSAGQGGRSQPLREGEFAREGEEQRAGKQEGDPGALDVVGDPRGGFQDEEYRTADPREVVESGGTVMSGPGGAPVDDSTPAERRDADR